mmetsp:Transcript_29820/g.33258  ORF Transcript_29820/g.33258 Transcript_29820/m.33258 type:complete len:245 (+) Transcript_29820:1277-2011(+)
MSISTISPVFIAQSGQIPPIPFKKISEEETAQYLYDLECLEPCKKIILQSRNSISSNFILFVYLAYTMTYFSRGMINEAWHVRKQQKKTSKNPKNNYAKIICKSLREDPTGIRHPLLGLFLVFDICIVIIHLRDIPLFVVLPHFDLFFFSLPPSQYSCELITYIYSSIPLPLCRPYLAALIRLANDTDLQYSKDAVIHIMIGMDAPQQQYVEPPPSPNDTLDTPPSSPNDILDTPPSSPGGTLE